MSEPGRGAETRALRTVQAGVVYFMLVFVAGWVLGPIREFLVIPRLGRTAGLLLEAPVMVLAIFASARWAIRRFAVPYVLTTRLAIGLGALGVLCIAEVIGVLWVRGLSVPNYLATFGPVSGGLSLLLFVAFAAMPGLVERR